MNYYVYEYLREDLTPYYIGKGSGNRAWRKNRNYYPGDDNRVKIIKDNLTEDQAFELEIELIAKHGRKDLGTGILRNQTHGGDGGTVGPEARKKISENAKGKPKTAETRRKMSESTKLQNARLKESGWQYPESAKQKIREVNAGKAYTDEARKAYQNTIKNRTPEEQARINDNNSAAQKGKKLSAETRAKMSAALKGKPKLNIVKTECCGKMYDPGNLSRHKKGQLKHKCQLP